MASPQTSTRFFAADNGDFMKTRIERLRSEVEDIGMSTRSVTSTADNPHFESNSHPRHMHPLRSNNSSF